MWSAKNIVIVLLFTVFIASLCFNVHFCTRSREHISMTDTTRITVYDTILYREPAPIRSSIVATVTGRLPAAPKHETTATEKTDSIQTAPAPSSETDIIEAVIPITQRVYEDSLYTAYVSGYEPKLDSIAVYPSREIVTVTNNYTAPKPKRWSIGVQAGYGVTLKGGTPQPAPYIGIGVSYNLISF